MVVKRQSRPPGEDRGRDWSGRLQAEGAQGCGPGASWERERPRPPCSLPVLVGSSGSERLGKAHSGRPRLHRASFPVKSHAVHALANSLELRKERGTCVRLPPARVRPRPKRAFPSLLPAQNPGNVVSSLSRRRFANVPRQLRAVDSRCRARVGWLPVCLSGSGPPSAGPGHTAQGQPGGVCIGNRGHHRSPDHRLGSFRKTSPFPHGLSDRKAQVWGGQGRAGPCSLCRRWRMILPPPHSAEGPAVLAPLTGRPTTPRSVSTLPSPSGSVSPPPGRPRS